MNPNIMFLSMAESSNCKCTIGSCHVHTIEPEDVVYSFYRKFDEEGNLSDEYTRYVILNLNLFYFNLLGFFQIKFIY